MCTTGPRLGGFVEFGLPHQASHGMSPATMFVHRNAPVALVYCCRADKLRDPYEYYTTCLTQMHRYGRGVPEVRRVMVRSGSGFLLGPH
jgi:hypothetical protein